MLKIIDWIKNDWKNSKYIFIMETINMLAGLSASGYIALSAPNTNWIIAYIFYCINSISGVLFSIKRKSFSILALNTFYSFLNMIILLKFSIA